MLAELTHGDGHSREIVQKYYTKTTWLRFPTSFSDRMASSESHNCMTRPFDVYSSVCRRALIVSSANIILEAQRLPFR